MKSEILDDAPKGTLYTKDIILSRLFGRKPLCCMWGRCQKNVGGAYSLNIGGTRYAMCWKHFRTWR